MPYSRRKLFTLTSTKSGVTKGGRAKQAYRIRPVNSPQPMIDPYLVAGVIQRYQKEMEAKRAAAKKPRVPRTPAFPSAKKPSSPVRTWRKQKEL